MVSGFKVKVKLRGRYSNTTRVRTLRVPSSSCIVSIFVTDVQRPAVMVRATLTESSRDIERT